MGADSLAENTPNAPKFICPICPPSPKVLDFNEKRLHWAPIVCGPGATRPTFFTLQCFNHLRLNHSHCLSISLFETQIRNKGVAEANFQSLVSQLLKHEIIIGTQSPTTHKYAKNFMQLQMNIRNLSTSVFKKYFPLIFSSIAE